MGDEAKCTAQVNGAAARGRARLEADTLEFRGEGIRVVLPFRQIRRVTARGGALSIDAESGTVSLELGPAAAKWAQKIQNPRSRLEKIGVKPDWRVSVLGVDDAEFVAELQNAAANVSISRAARNSDAIFFGATDEAQLAKLEKLKSALKPNGALWVIRPKGRPEISETAVMAAGSAAGLVDVKVVRFSSTHTAEKFVIPLSKRGPAHE